MTPSPHLTEEQFAAALDSPRPELAAHLTHCASCRDEVAALHAALSTFRGAVTNFAAIHTSANLLATTPVPTKQTLWFRQPVWAGSCAAAVLLVAASLWVNPAVRHAPQPTTQPTAQTSAAVLSPAQPAESDDAFLASINRDLSTSIPPSLAPLALPADSSDNSTTHRKDSRN